MEADFLFDRCREVQANPNGYLDLWARYHFKTTIVTFGYTIFTMINDPERTTCILSQNNKAATKKLMQVKSELESNHDFVELFNDLFEHDVNQYKLWSQEKGLVIKRRGNPAVATLASFGLVDAQPTGDHYTDRVYDDVVVPESVVSDISISNTNTAWEQSLNLGMEGGVARYVGTRYHFNDTYSLMMEREAVKVRRYPCFHMDEEGRITDIPVLYSKEYLENERRGMGPYTWACVTGDQRILMWDFTQKPIGDVEIGDVVVGWEVGRGGFKKIVPSRVLSKGCKRRPVFEYRFQSGRKVKCTADHRWYTGTTSVDDSTLYKSITDKYGRQRLGSLCRLIDPEDVRTNEEYRRDKIHPVVEPLGEKYVYALQTETCNYVVEGLMSRNCQMLLDPVAESQQGFDTDWCRTYTRTPREERSGRIVYLIGDPAGEEKKGADYTAMAVLGLGSDKKIRLLDGVVDRINLTKRWKKFSELHKKWKPLYSIYERVGKDPEVEYFRERMMQEGYIFNIIEVGGNKTKTSRINRLVAPFENGDILLPKNLFYFSEYEGREIDLVHILKNIEMRGYPMSDNDHLLDAISRLYDPDVPLAFPQSEFDPLTGDQRRKKDAYERGNTAYGRSTWLSI
jgi:phage terminase large subunit-like protein